MRAVSSRGQFAVLLVCGGLFAAAPVAGESAPDAAGSPGAAEGGSRLEVPSNPAAGSATDRDSLLFQARCCSPATARGVLPRQRGRAGRGPRLRGRKLPADYLTRVIRDGIPNSTMGSWGTGCPTVRSPPSSRSYRCSPTSLLAIPTRCSGAADSPRRTSAGWGRQPSRSRLRPRPRASTGPGRGRSLFLRFRRRPRLRPLPRHRRPGVDGRSRPRTAGLGAAADAAAGDSDPGRLRDSGGRVIELVTTAGDTLEVLRLGETETRVKLFDVTRFPPVTRNVRKDRILSEQPTSRSAMPDTYASRYTVQQLLDLISFIRAGSGGPPVAFEELF